MKSRFVAWEEGDLRRGNGLPKAPEPFLYRSHQRLRELSSD
jgi:hypothetical protein